MNIRTLTNKLKAKYTFVGGEQHGYIKVGKNAFAQLCLGNAYADGDGVEEDLGRL